MNNDLIRLSRKAANAWRNDDEYYQVAVLIDSLCDMLEKAPAVDAVEVVHAKWIRPTKINGITFDMPHCSACHEVPCDTRNYCPFCGARMDGK